MVNNVVGALDARGRFAFDDRKDRAEISTRFQNKVWELCFFAVGIPWKVSNKKIMIVHWCHVCAMCITQYANG